MPTPRWPNTPLAKYPHLAGSDIPTWNHWIGLYGHNFLGFNYDTHVGIGLEPDKDAPYAYQMMWTKLTQKRIDVIGYLPKTTWLIEVKDRPTVAAVGQVIGYTILYQIDHPNALPIIPAIIAGVIEPDIETVCRHLGIRFYDLSDGHHWLFDPLNPPLTRS